MTPFTDLVQQSATAVWFFIPSAILLGALHGLEPGHSKTMMAAFIVAIRGTIGQAILLALTATLSHTAIVWIVAILALSYGSHWSAEATEPYLQLFSAAVIVALALWMSLRTWREQRAARESAAHSHGGHDHAGHDAHGHHRGHAGPDSGDVEFQDAHARAHMREIRQRASGRTVTTGQVAVFGLTGGLLPCPAAVTVLLLCLQLKQFWLGIVLVLCFSIGLALTLLASGVVAAWSVRHAIRRWSGFDSVARKLPYLSSALIVCAGLYVGWQGWSHLA
ncbi:MAG: nickel/cobalt efflux transporter RcnA [Proteobacteria bacterium]|nr:nickel/cobalt efflux transporter RcnA [Pseudomonadota bacterium]